MPGWRCTAAARPGTPCVQKMERRRSSWSRCWKGRRKVSRHEAAGYRPRSRLDPLLNVVGALAGAEFDDAQVGEAVREKRIVPHDRLDFRPAFPDGQDDPAISRNFSTRDQEMT